MTLLVRRALILVGIAVASAVLAYVFNRGNDTATPAPAVATQQTPDAQLPGGPRFREYEPDRRFHHDGGFRRH